MLYQSQFIIFDIYIYIYIVSNIVLNYVESLEEAVQHGDWIKQSPCIQHFNQTK